MSDERGPLSFGDDAPDEADASREAPLRARRTRGRERTAETRADRPLGRAPGARTAVARACRGTRRPAQTGEPPRGARSRLPGLILLLAGFLLLVVVGLNTLRTEGVSSTGPAKGDDLPPFAAPLVLSDVEGDVNLAREPDQGAAGKRPACEVRDAGVLNSCDLFAGRPAVLAFLAAGERRCVDELDALDRALRSRPSVRAAAIAVRGDRGDLRAVVRDGDWSFPVAHDRDGALANVLGVAVCPQLTFVLPGGRVHDSVVGEIGAAGLGTRLDALVRAAAERDPARPAAGRARRETLSRCARPRCPRRSRSTRAGSRRR